MTRADDLSHRFLTGFSHRVTHASAELAGARALRLFCTPILSSHKAPDHERLVERARFHLRSAVSHAIETRVGQVRAYVMEPNEPPVASVLLVHGWTGEAAFMSAFGDYLRRRGFRSILLDLPAHGASAGYRTTLMDCAHAVREAAQAMGPVRFVVGHSVGGLAALVAGEGRKPMPRAHPFDAYVLVSMPDRFQNVTRQFGAERRLSPAAQRVFERRLERLACRRIVDFTGANLLRVVDRPVLVIHSRDDAQVPYHDAEGLAGATAGTAIEPLDGLGHRMILYAPPAVRSAARFLLAQV